MQRLSDWYDHPEYYEAIFGTDTAKEVDFLEEVSRRHGTGGQRWLEPACGAGRLVAEAAGPGRPVRVVPEGGSDAAAVRACAVLGEELAGLLGRDDTERFRTRLHRYRHLGR